jgi:hypothetical protein
VTDDRVEGEAMRSVFDNLDDAFEDEGGCDTLIEWG